MYKLTTGWPQHLESGAFVNPDSNPEYLAWLSEGNTPSPADVPDPKQAIRAQIESLEAQQLLPRITREFMLSAAEAQAQAAGVDPNVNVGYRLLKQFDNSIAALRAQL